MFGPSITLFDLFTMGGPFMWPLLAFSVAALAITLERAAYFFTHCLSFKGLEEALLAYLDRGDIPGARAYLESLGRRRLASRVLLALVNALAGEQANPARLESAAEIAALSCINSLETGFNYLKVIGSLAPLTGFLGTVSGMIGAFKAIAEASDVNAQIVANGIYEALITTVFGLIIAIFAIASHSLLNSAVDKFASNAEVITGDLILSVTGESRNAV